MTLTVKGEKLFCERCGKAITSGREVWLELSWKTNKFSAIGSGEITEEESQGCFVFGPDCAKHPNAPYYPRD